MLTNAILDKMNYTEQESELRRFFGVFNYCHRYTAHGVPLNVFLMNSKRNNKRKVSWPSEAYSCILSVSEATMLVYPSTFITKAGVCRFL